MPEAVAVEMARAKVGFAIRFVNKSRPEDALLPEEFFEHNQAAFEFFLSIQEAADKRMKLSGFPYSSLCHVSSNVHPIAAKNNEDDDAVKPTLSIKPFVKHEKNSPFYVVPVLSPVVFPQFKGNSTPGVLRVAGQRGTRLSFLYPHCSKSDRLLHRSFVVGPE
jgi:hypothetical protein